VSVGTHVMYVPRTTESFPLAPFAHEFGPASELNNDILRRSLEDD
jgi:hypothetical protein